MTYLVLIFSAVLAAALTPVTARVASRSNSIIPWCAVPLSLVISTTLVWSSNRLFSVNAIFGLGLAVVAAILAVQVVIDLCVRRLLRELSYAGLLVFVVCAFFVEPMRADGVRSMVIGAVLMTAIALILLIASRGALGMGDLHLSPLLGALIGWYSPGLVLLAWMITAIAGALCTSVGLATKRLSRGAMIPYGPFMVFGTVTSIAVIAMRA